MTKRNYLYDFYGMERLPQQTMCKHGELACVYTGEIFNDTIVDAYNRYTADFNRATDRAMQEFLLDQRFNFIHAYMRDNLKELRQCETK